MNIFAKLEKQKDTWFIIGTSFIFFLLRLPSLFEPLWYGDEGIYEVIGKAIASGRLLYRDIWDNKPPLLYYIYSLVDGDQFGAKLLSLLVGIATVIAFFFLAKKLIHSRERISTFLFALLFGLPLLEGNIANAENFMLLPIILGAIFIFNFVENKKSHLFLAGLLLGLAFLIKIVALFDAAAFGIIIFIAYYTKLSRIKNLIIPFISLYTGFLIPIVIIIVYFWANRALHDFIVSTFLSNIGYVGYANKFVIPQGFLILKLLLLAAAVCIVFYKRHKISFSGIFIYIWLAFSLFNMFFSQRPYVHYALVIIPSLCLLIGYTLTLKQGLKTKNIIIVLLCIATLLLHFNFKTGDVGKLIGYYKNYIDFLTKRINADAYYHFFDPAALRDEQLAQFINMHKLPHDSVFVWGNSGQLYMLTNALPPGKYIVAYHMTFTNTALQETKQILNKVKPNYIILLPNQPSIPYDLKNYSSRFSIDGATIYSL